jgi:uncharacterized protein (TIGR02246 family)
MKLRTLSPFLVGLFIVSCAGEPEATPEAEAAPETAAPEMSADEQAIASIAEAWQEHFNAGNAAQVADLYVDELFQLSANGEVSMGRDALVASLSETMAISPTLDLTPRETMVAGDMAVAWGGYAIEATPPDADPMGYSGTWITVFTKASGDWEIWGSLNNYDAAPPEGVAFAEPGEAPAEEGTMADVIEAYETHWNQGHPSMVADLYTDDAMAAFANSPPVNGRAAIEATLTERMGAAPTTIAIHDVGTQEFGDGWAIDGGWYEITSTDSGEPVQAGSYMTLARQAEDGSWQLHWAVTNGRTADQM